MRLSEHKIELLCRAIYQELGQSKYVLWDRAEKAAVEAMKRVFVEDLQAEDELDAEVERILEEHREEIRRKGADFNTMRKKTKQLLARERKMVL